MIRRCQGWGKPKHEVKVIGEKAPFDDGSFTDGICGDCRLWFKAQSRVRINALLTDGRVISYRTDRLGAALRLKCIRRMSTFQSHSVTDA